MQRTKVFAVAATLVAAGAATLLFAGGASAASWHVYEGDIYAGHAYGLEVPRDAEGIEFRYDGPDGGRAALSVHDAEGAKLGYYELTPATPAASIANPDAGLHVVYVYAIDQGAVSVRVNSDKAPDLDLTQVALDRVDVKLGHFEQGKLDQVVTQKMETPPVFLTLLYEGSARDLDATVSSSKGAVVTIADETATAFSPGVWTSSTGSRVFDAANLDGTTYTIEIHAASFEGTLVLTTLALDLDAPAPPAEWNFPMPLTPRSPPPSAEGKAAARPGAPGAPEFALEEKTAVAFHASAGKLLLFDPTQLVDEDESEEEEYEYDGGHCPGVSLVAIYTPEDALLAVIELNGDEPAAELDLPVSGEYVAYVHQAPEEGILAKLPGAAAAPTLRVLDLAHEEISASFDSALLGGLPVERETTAIEFTLDYVPVTFSLWMGEDAVTALSDVEVSNELGSVARTNAIVAAPYASFLAWSEVDLENLAAGEHVLTVDGLHQGSVTLTITRYLRETAAVAEPAEVEKGTDAGKPSDPPAPPMPPGLPLAAPPALPKLGLPL